MELATTSRTAQGRVNAVLTGCLRIKALKSVHTATHPALPISATRGADAYRHPGDDDGTEDVGALSAILDREANEEDA